MKQNTPDWTALEQMAEKVATQAHAGQRRKFGKREPYIEHPKRVRDSAMGPVVRVVALLHDVVEDTPLTLTDLQREGFPAVVLGAVDAITRRPGEGYLHYLRRAWANPYARIVKGLDIADNWRTIPEGDTSKQAHRMRTKVELAWIVWQSGALDNKALTTPVR